MEFNQRQEWQLDAIYNAAYELLKILAVPEDMTAEEAEEFFPWDMYLIGEMTDAAVDVLKTKGFGRIYYPYEDENGEIHDYDED